MKDLVGIWLLPLDRDCQRHVDAARVGYGREGVEEVLVEEAEEPGLADGVERGVVHGRDGVDGDGAHDEEEVVEGQTDQQVVEGVAAHLSVERQKT